MVASEVPSYTRNLPTESFIRPQLLFCHSPHGHLALMNGSSGSMTPPPPSPCWPMAMEARLPALPVPWPKERAGDNASAPGDWLKEWKCGGSWIKYISI